MISDMFNKPVNVTRNANSVSIGAFLLAAENHHNTYMKYSEIFESLNNEPGDEFEKIAALQ